MYVLVVIMSSSSGEEEIDMETSSSSGEEEIDMVQLFRDLERLLNDYALKTAAFFNEFGYKAINPEEVKNVHSWQRDSDQTFDYLQEWCEETTNMDLNYAHRLGNVSDLKPPSLVDVMDEVDSQWRHWNKYYGREMSGCPYCNVACKEGIHTCGSDKCMAHARRDYALKSLNLDF